MSPDMVVNQGLKMQYAIIENNVIDNIAEADEPLAENWELLPEGVGRGWVRSGPG